MRDYEIRPHIEGHDIVYGEEFRIPTSLYKYMRHNGVSRIHANENLISGTGAYITIDMIPLGGDYSYSARSFENLVSAVYSLEPEDIPRALALEHHPLGKLILQWRLLT
jgi:hypothetical protein